MAEKQWSEMTQDERWRSFNERMDALEDWLERFGREVDKLKRINFHQNNINKALISTLETLNGNPTADSVG